MLLTPFSNKTHGTRVAKKMEHPLFTKMKDLEEQLSKMELKQEDGPPRMDPAVMASGGRERLLDDIDDFFWFMAGKLRTKQMKIRTTVDNLMEERICACAGPKLAEITRMVQTCDKLESTLRKEEARFEHVTPRRSTYLMIMQALT